MTGAEFWMELGKVALVGAIIGACISGVVLGWYWWRTRP